DIHDRVNHAVTSSKLNIYNGEKKISLDIDVDTEISPVMEYFEIFLSRMVISQRAARYFESEFELIINGTKIL
ncbi:MAG: phosphohydrolase, partial [FCB group bacterium]|nr:phosphohydrolase [FCB group bacterium]